MRVVRYFNESSDPAALAAKSKPEMPHSVFGTDFVNVHDSTGNLLVGLYHVSYFDDDKIAYDEVLRVERGGSIFLPVSPNNLIGLRKVWRPQTTDVDYRKCFPTVNLSQVGQMTWDVCGGFGDPDATPEEQARTEAEEEGRGIVTKIEYLGKTVMNRASDIHFTHLFWGAVDFNRQGRMEKDPFERLAGSIRFFTKSQVFDLFQKGELYDQCVLSALWAFENKYPGRLAP